MSDENQTTTPTVRILLVEDHALTRVGIKTVLKREPDFAVVGEASNGEEAVAQAEALKPDIILMDVGMPVMDGIQASRKIVESGNAAKIIMLTQHDNDQDILASLAAGASGYCLKDVESSRLYMAIRTVNVGDSWLDSAIAGKVLKLYSKQAAPVQDSKSAVDEAPKASAGDTIVENEPKSFEPDRPYAEPLSPRELEVLTLIVEGLSNQQISDRLFISLPTTKTHVRNILNKLAVDDRTQAAVHAMRRGIV
ncbi:MAG: response regulator transcription factor [Candidatus Melainabacteria bacterium]|nr:response regulator transcription factor [Candidatus Melainabacteria bacterium]